MPFDRPTIDARLYADQGYEIATASFWHNAGAAPGEGLPTFQSPLVSYVCAATTWTASWFVDPAGGRATLQRAGIAGFLILQAVMHAGGVLLLRRVARGALPERWATAAMFVWAAWGPALYFAGLVLYPIVLVLCHLAALLALKRWNGALRAGSAGSRWLAAAGLIGGIAITGLANILVPLMFMTVWVGAVAARHRGRSGALAAVALFGLCTAATGSFLAIRNAIATHRFEPLPMGSGIQMWIGNNPDYPATVDARPGIAFDRIFKKPMAEWGAEPGRWAWRDAFRQRVSRYWMEHPASALRGVADRTLQFGWGHEERRDSDLYEWAEVSGWGGWLMWELRVEPGFGLAFPYGVLWPFVLAGAVAIVSERRARRRGAAPRFAVPSLIAGHAAAWAISFWPFFMCARYRVAAVPLLIVIGLYGLRAVWLHLTAARTSQLSHARGRLLAAALAAGFVWQGLFLPADNGRDRQEEALWRLEADRIAGVAHTAAEYEALLALPGRHGWDVRAGIIENWPADRPLDEAVAIATQLIDEQPDSDRGYRLRAMVVDAMRLTSGDPAWAYRLAMADMARAEARYPVQDPLIAPPGAEQDPEKWINPLWFRIAARGP